jgi:hypothetical protein
MWNQIPLLFFEVSKIILKELKKGKTELGHLLKAIVKNIVKKMKLTFNLMQELMHYQITYVNQAKILKKSTINWSI